MTAPEFARATSTPLHVVRGIMEKLSLGGVLAVTRKADDRAYQPAIDPGLITLMRVWDALREGESVDPSGLPAEAARLQAALQELKGAAAESSANQQLREIR